MVEFDDKTSRSERILGSEKSLNAEKGKLSVMPFAVLLPSMGDISALPALRPLLEKRFRDLQVEISTAGGEVEKERLSEASMLNQVGQWLSLGDEDSGNRK